MNRLFAAAESDCHADDAHGSADWMVVDKPSMWHSTRKVRAGAEAGAADASEGESRNLEDWLQEHYPVRGRREAVCNRKVVIHQPRISKTSGTVG